MGCPGNPKCGGQAETKTPQVAVTMIAANQAYVRYNAPEDVRTVSHKVYAKSGTYYGIRTHGDQFKVLRRDLDDDRFEEIAVSSPKQAAPVAPPPSEPTIEE